MSFPAYNKISKATKDLRDASKITDRRKAAAALKGLLFDTTIRSKLAKESAKVAKDQNLASPVHGLHKIYNNAIKAALHATKKTLDSSTKKKSEDVVLPFKIFSLVDKDSDAAIAALKKDKQNRFDECEPFTFESFDRYRDTNAYLSHVSARELRELLEFCLGCLDDTDLNELAEADLLNMLQKLCSRPDYVAHFHPLHDLRDILIAVQERLLQTNDRAGGVVRGVDCSVNAAKSFYNLIHQLTAVLEIDISGSVKTSLALIVDWVRNCTFNAGSNGNSNSSQIRKYMYGAAVNILSAYPEQCVTVLSQDDYGKDLFGYARRCWGVSRGLDRDALVGYFSSHLFVCEVAGNLQGLFPGDLGDLKNASLDREKLGYLKEMLLSESNLEAFSIMTASAEPSNVKKQSFNGSRRGVKRRKKGVAELEQFQPLSKIQRRYLELCARILRCTQRLHLADSECSSSDDVQDLLFNECINGSSRGLGSDRIIDGLSASPWVTSIATAAFGFVISSEARETPSMEYASLSPMEIESMNLSQESEGNASADKDTLLSRLPMLAAIGPDITNEPKDSQIIVYLQLISACTEVFPRGECWSSINQWFETNYSPIDSKESGENSLTYCNACSILDMASVVYSLSLILSRYGIANGNCQVQMWSLICLLKLTEASHIFCRYLDVNDAGTASELTLAWRCVWNHLLHSELRYHSSTLQPRPSSVGNLVLMLLTEIVRGGLTDNEKLGDNSQDKQLPYVRKHQDKIWGLPAFSSAIGITSSTPFELASIVILRAGLVEGETDSICLRGSDAIMQKMIKIEAEKGRGRRLRLANFCLQFISQGVKNCEVETIRRIAMFTASLFCALLDTSEVIQISTFTLQAYRDLKVTDHIYEPSCTDFRREQNIMDTSVLNILWEDSLHPFSFQFSSDVDRSVWRRLDGRDMSTCPFWSLSDRSWLAAKFRSMQKNSVSHCPLQTATDVKDYGLSSISNILTNLNSDKDINGKSDLESLPCRIASVKIALAIALCGDDIKRNKASWSSIELCAYTVISEAVSNINTLCTSKDAFSYVFTDVISIIRLARSVMSATPSAGYINGILPVKLCSELYNSCEKLVRLYTKHAGSCFSFSQDSKQPFSPGQESDFGPSDDDGDDFAISSRQLSAFSGSSESDLDKFDSEEESRGLVKKRKRRNKSTTPKRSSQAHLRHQVEDSRNHAPSSRCLWICATVMIHIEPSVESGCIIADAILWPRSAANHNSFTFDPDEPHDHLIFLGLLLNYASFGWETICTDHKDDGNQLSMTSLCLDAISQCRDVSGVSSPMHCWGFDACEALMSKRLRRNAPRSFSSGEVDQIVKVLQPEGKIALRALKNRPVLRYIQVRAGTKCFLNGDDAFHKIFDNTYASSFVMKSLKDRHPKVRRAGIEALGAALALFPHTAQDKIANDALAAFPPKPSFDYSEEKKAFSEWVDDKVHGTDNYEVKERIWKEIRTSVEADKLICIQVIGGYTTDDKVVLKMTSALLLVSRIKKYRYLAFQQLEALARCRNFEIVEEMLRNDQMKFLKSWIRKGRLLSSLPCSFTMPSLVRAMMRLDLHVTSDSRQKKKESPQKSIFCETTLFETTAEEYIFQNASYIVPLVFIANIDRSEEMKDILSNPQSSKAVEDGNFIKNLLVEVSNACTDGNMKPMIKAHFHQIYAHLIPFLVIDQRFEESSTVRQSAHDLLNMLSKNVHKQVVNSSALIVLELLNVSMEKTLFYGNEEFPCNFFVLAMKFLSRTIAGEAEQMDHSDIFRSTFTNATECILSIRMIAESSKYSNVKLDAWNIMDAIVSLVQSDYSKSNELGFCIVSMLSNCLNTIDDSLRLAILVRMEKIIIGISKREKESLVISLFVNKIVSSLIQLHEEYQLKLIDFFQISWKKYQTQERYFTSLRSDSDNHNALQNVVYNVEQNEYESMKSSVEEFSNQVSTDIMKCISLTYDVFALILDSNAAFSEQVQDSLDPFPESEIAISALRIMEAFNHKCCLLSVMQKFDCTRNERGDMNFEKKIKTFLSISTRFRATEKNPILYSRMKSSTDSNLKSHLSPEVRSLLSALKHLNNDIQNHSRQGVGIRVVTTKLAEELFRLCDKQFLREIQLAATHCLGNLGLLSQNLDLSYALLDQQQQNVDGVKMSDPLSKVYSLAFAQLSQMIQSDDVYAAVEAKNTVKALLATTDGFEHWRNAETNSNTQRILGPFDNGKLKRYNKIELSDVLFQNLIKIVNKSDIEVKTDKSWCWDDSLWILQSDDSVFYEDWIKNLVCALILCCYITNPESTSAMPIKGTSDFFPACLAMSARDHQFAATIFQGIVYDLLFSDCSDDYDCPDAPNRSHLIGAPFSLANQKLTCCFSTFLSSVSSLKTLPNTDSQQTTAKIQATRTVIKTLNMLRLVTEHGFSQIKHRKNVMQIKGRRYDYEKKKCKIPDDLYNEKLPPAPLWKGRPYGIVLHLTGTDLAYAYANTKDYASALYYAELFADCRLGGSGSIFERLDHVDVVQSSMSGFGVPIEANLHYGGDNRILKDKKIDLAISLHHILQRCLSGLHEDEALAGLEEQTSSIRFDRPECFSEGIPLFQRIAAASDILTGLVSLDARAQLNNNDNLSTSRLAVSTGLNQLGLREISRQYLAGAFTSRMFRSEDEHKQLMDQWAEESWRQLQWDESLLIDKPGEATGYALPSSFNIQNNQYKTGFHLSLKNTIVSLLEEDLSSFETNLSTTRLALLDEFHTKVGQIAPVVELNSYTLKACTINQLEDLGAVVSGSEPAKSWLKKYCTEVDLFSRSYHVDTQFSDLECSMAAHEVFLKILFKKFGESAEDEIGNELSSHLWKLCSTARERDRPNVALSALERLKKISNLHNTSLENDDIQRKLLSLRYSFEEAKIAQCAGNTTAAVRICKEVMNRLERSPKQELTESHCVLLIETQLQCAEWLIRYPIESNTVIQNDLLKPAAILATKLLKAKRGSPSLVASTNFALGDFVADLYDSVQKRVNSQEWKTLGHAASGRRRQQEDLEKLIREANKSKGRDERYLKTALNQLSAVSKEVMMDTKERNAVEDSVYAYLELAMNAYGTALCQCSSDTDSTRHVFRLISLWFRNCNVFDRGIHQQMSSWFLEIPSYHFVPLIYQIFSRIDASSDPNIRAEEEFQPVLQNLVCKICIDHPYHGLIQLIALSNGNNVAQSTYANAFSGDEEKVGSIMELIQRVKSTSPRFVAELLDSYQILTDAYIALAMAPTRQLTKKKMTKQISFLDIKLSKGQALNNCMKYRSIKPCVLTLRPHIRQAADYGEGESDPIGAERIKTFMHTFSLTETGIHRPKIVMCEGTSGKFYKQLVKGDDDIRQDAVMQQVFSAMNVFLRNKKNQSPGHKKLRLITYSCVPLSPAAGVLEWVENTVPIGQYLTNSSPCAHTRYYPGEWTSYLCHVHMAMSPPSARRKSFDEVCKHFSPAFRFFFLENFAHSPLLWYSARMSYTRSCAVNSMVGHILGIGDRHSSNILIHQDTGEVVHIDFGFVFEQGKVQSTPETVPFRLTRDIVDGMGPTGTEGVFTNAARDTMEVLRENSSALLTVLAAVVADPLYKWNISMTKGRKREQGEENSDDGDSVFMEVSEKNAPEVLPAMPFVAESKNDAATRAIARIHEKLKGYEEGTLGERQTIEGQVRLLINEARDPNNLCMLFPGWGPWI